MLCEKNSSGNQKESSGAISSSLYTPGQAFRFLSRAMDRFSLKRFPLIAALIVSAVLLAGCGGGDAPSPTSTPEPTSTVAPLPPGAITVGDLLAQMDIAWPSVTSFRTTFWSTTGTDFSTPPATGLVTIEEAVLPATRRVIQLTDGVVTDEQIVVDGRIYMKGALVPAAIAPMMDVSTWVEIDPSGASSNSPAAMQIAYLTSPIASPFAEVSDETRGLQAVPAGEVTINGRTCTPYTFGDPSTVSYELALDANNLPCRLTMTAGGSTNVTTYEVNPTDIAIAAPDLATPAAE